MHVLICAGGVIGSSIAYFLSWGDGSPLAPLARRSFALHAVLAEKIADDWGYRRLDTYGGFARVARPRGAYALGWLSDAVTVT